MSDYRGAAEAAARRIVGPYLKGKGYRVLRGAGPGVAWYKPHETGQFTFGIYTRPWNEWTGGEFEAKFGGDILDMYNGSFLRYAAEDTREEWLDLFRQVLAKALGPDGDPDPEVMAARREGLAEYVRPANAPYLTGGSWLWFDELDLDSFFLFAVRHFDDSERAALAKIQLVKDDELNRASPGKEPPSQSAGIVGTERCCDHHR